MAAVCIIHLDVALNLFYGHSYFQNNKEKFFFNILIKQILEIIIKYIYISNFIMDNNPGHVSTSQKIPLNRYNNLTCTSGLAIQALYHLREVSA